MTNGDKIRRLDDESLAEMFRTVAIGSIGQTQLDFHLYYEQVLQWLKSEATENDQIQK